MKVGVLVNSLKLDVREGVIKAAELGFDGIQVGGMQGEMSPENLSQSGREEFRDFVAAQNLELAALVGEVGGFEDAATLEQRVDKVKEVLALAADLEVKVVSGHIGTVSPDENDPKRMCIADGLNAIGEFGEKVGVFYAGETGRESAVIMKEFLDGLKSKCVKVNYDPANLVMAANDDPIAGVATLAGYIVHTHAKDGVRKGDWTLQELHALIQEKGRENVNMADYAEEVPLGEGQVGFPQFVEALANAGYDGFLTIERETGENPIDDVRRGRDLLRKILSEMAG